MPGGGSELLGGARGPEVGNRLRGTILDRDSRFDLGVSF